MIAKTRRREFLFASAAAVTAPWLPVATAAAAAELTGPGPHLGVVTHQTLENYDLETIIKLLETTGFECVELRTEHKHGVEPSIGQAERERVRQRFARSKVKLTSFGTICDFHSPDPAERKRQVEIGKQFVDLARDTGAFGIKVRPNELPRGVPRDTTIQNIAGGLRELGEYGGPKGIQIWMEVHGTGTADPKVTELIMQATQHKNVGLCWNCNDEDIVNGSVKPSWELLRSWVRTIHLKDLGAPPHNPYPWDEFFGLLRADKFNGYEFCESDAVFQQVSQTERYLRGYKALWTKYQCPCACA